MWHGVNRQSRSHSLGTNTPPMLDWFHHAFETQHDQHDVPLVNPVKITMDSLSVYLSHKLGTRTPISDAKMPHMKSIE
jgi:hypothetical protein